MEYARWLARPVPSQVAAAMCSRAVSGDVSAARELCDRTEGRVPASVNVEGKIDYAAGQDAKEQLLKRLGAVRN